jgi:hypothetical protein
MSRNALVAPLMLALAACASTPDPGPAKLAAAPTPPAQASPNSPPPASNSGPSAAGWAVSILGTPFALGMKTVACAATLVVAAPVAGFLTLGVDPSGEGYQVLGNGIAANCGPPYVVSPDAAS